MLCRVTDYSEVSTIVGTFGLFIGTVNMDGEIQMINANRVENWKKDIKKSVDLYNDWFMNFAPEAYRTTRVKTTEQVQRALGIMDNLTKISTDVIELEPSIVQVLRMCTSPPLARDRLTGLGGLNKSLLKTMEEKGIIPPRMKKSKLQKNLNSISGIIHKLLDNDIFTWLENNTKPSKEEVYRASTIIADRLCGAVANPIIKNAQEKRQLEQIENYLQSLGYIRLENFPSEKPITDFPRGTYSFRMNVIVRQIEEDELDEGEIENKIVNMPIDCIIMRKNARAGELPILIECKSAGDFANTNKRRKEEPTKIRQLRNTYGKKVKLYLFLCGYFDATYLGYEASEGLDWIWEHRISDMERLGL